MHITNKHATAKQNRKNNIAMQHQTVEQLIIVAQKTTTTTTKQFEMIEFRSSSINRHGI